MGSIPPLASPLAPSGEPAREPAAAPAPAATPAAAPPNTFQPNAGATSSALTGAPAAPTPIQSNFSLGNAVPIGVVPRPIVVPVVPVPPGGSATLSWTIPTHNTDGSVLTNLAGYKIHFGTSPTNLNMTIDVPGGAVNQHVVSGLAPGTWYFAVTCYNSNGVESALSNEADKIIP